MASQTRAVLSAFAVLALVATAVSSAQDGATSAQEQIRDLMTQKRDVLKKRVATASQLYGSGKLEKTQVLEAEADLLAARLDLATSKAGRIAILEEKLKNRRQLDELYQQRILRGTGKPTEALAATADRLDAEIALLRARSQP